MFRFDFLKLDAHLKVGLGIDALKKLPKYSFIKFAEYFKVLSHLGRIFVHDHEFSYFFFVVCS